MCFSGCASPKRAHACCRLLVGVQVAWFSPFSVSLRHLAASIFRIPSIPQQGGKPHSWKKQPQQSEPLPAQIDSNNLSVILQSSLSYRSGFAKSQKARWMWSAVQRGRSFLPKYEPGRSLMCRRGRVCVRLSLNDSVHPAVVLFPRQLAVIRPSELSGCSTTLSHAGTGYLSSPHPTHALTLSTTWKQK